MIGWKVMSRLEGDDLVTLGRKVMTGMVMIARTQATLDGGLMRLQP
jgi:hypothetical protein